MFPFQSALFKLRVLANALLYVAIFVGLTPLLCAQDTARTRVRPTRAESFFGVHFDFHAGVNNQNIGAQTTPEMVQTIIDTLKPDFIQIDCKGHPGWTSYKTQVGNMAPGVVADSLKVWREVTARNGVALYLHYSGVWDSAAVEKHPEWAALDKNGNRSHEKTSVFRGYRTGLLVPQLLEIANEYEVDGVWVDGECWATQIDYSEEAQNAFKEATRLTTVPHAPNEDGWLEWCDFHREAFRRYLRAYVADVHANAPNFQIASNWAFTDHMPEPVSAEVDFISGDYSPNNSVNAARYSARLMANQGFPWDLMAWSFGGQSGAWAQKTGVQLCREAACVLAMGGSFQGYITQEPDGSVNLEKLPGMTEASTFCRARQQWCKGSDGIPQIALFCPAATHYKLVSSGGESLFPMITWQRPLLYRLLEQNYSVDILTDKALSERADEFPVIVFYRSGDWSPTLTAKIREYLRNGGAVVALGAESQQALSSTLAGVQPVETQQGDSDFKFDVYRVGRGTCLLLATPEDAEALADFNNAQGQEFEQSLREMIHRVLPRPIVQIKDTRPLDVSVRRTANGELAAHFVNVSGNHETAGIIESIEPVENVDVTLALETRPTSLRLEPSGLDLDFTWNDSNKTASTTIPKIPIYEILVVK